ncbi:MAG: hypothetical protein AAF467_02200 [Actinomycetota bacterium]
MGQLIQYLDERSKATLIAITVLTGALSFWIGTGVGEALASAFSG